LKYLNFNKVISKLLAVDVKIEEKDNALILLSSISESYNHIAIIMLYGKETRILEEVTSTLLPNKISKMSNQVEQEGSGLVVMEKKGKRSSGSSKACYFCQQESHWMDGMHRQAWLKKKGQAVEANIAMSSVDTEVFMTSYIGDNTSQGKYWISDNGSMVHACSHKDIFNFLDAKEKGTVKMVDGSACNVIGTRIFNVT